MPGADEVLVAARSALLDALIGSALAVVACRSWRQQRSTIEPQTSGRPA